MSASLNVMLDANIIISAIYSPNILVTGDKDFLESSVTNPEIITAARFVQSEQL
jgi:predicted nucleic acid-binding protein